MTTISRTEFIEQWDRSQRHQREAYLAKIRPTHGLSVFKSPGELAMALDPLTIQTPMFDLIDSQLLLVRDAIAVQYERKALRSQLIQGGMDVRKAIERAQNEIEDRGIKRLAVSTAPQEGKSSRISRYFPLWLMQQFPTLRTGLFSYDLDNASQFTSAMLADITTFDGAEGNLDLGLRLRWGQRAQSYFALKSGGSVRARGKGGGTTGRPIECFTGETRIVTEGRYTSIRDLYQSTNPPKVLTWNHKEQRTEWKRIIAGRVSRDREVVEVTTTAGRRIVCTPDHRIFTADGYRKAELLRYGDSLVTGSSNMPTMWQGVSSQVQRDGARLLQPDLCLHGASQVQAMSTMWGGTNAERAKVQATDLPAVPSRSVSHRPAMRGLWTVVQEASVRDRQTHKDRPDAILLLSRLCSRWITKSWSSLPTMRESNGFNGQGAVLLRERVPQCDASAAEAKAMPALRSRVQILQHKAHVLLSSLRQCGSLIEDDRGRQLTLQGRDQLRSLVSEDATAHQGTRWRRLPYLSKQSEAVNSSSERNTVGEQSRESDNAVSTLPFDSPSLECDTVSAVRRLHGERHDVYDLQVEGNSNFFAEEILVHNCAVLDDLLKDQEDADSETNKAKLWTWLQTVLFPRLAPDAPVVMVMTRWAEDDPFGRFEQQQKDLEAQGVTDFLPWTVINIPSKAEENDPLGRKPGEWLLSARGRTESQWRIIEATTDPKHFDALYQGRPSVAGGDIFLDEWWREYNEPVWRYDPETNAYYCDEWELWQSWDLAFKDKASNDFVAGGVFATRGSTSRLVTLINKHLSITNTIDAMRRMKRLFPRTGLILVEDKANGSGVIDLLSGEIEGIVPITPKQSKAERARLTTPYVRAGNIQFPSKRLVGIEPELSFDLDAYRHQMITFRENAPHDDMVDMTTQFLNEHYRTGEATIEVPETRIPTGPAIARGNASATPRSSIIADRIAAARGTR